MKKNQKTKFVKFQENKLSKNQMNKLKGGYGCWPK